MTSVIKVAAHCSAEKEVVVKVFDAISHEVKEEVVLQDGQTAEKHVYDNLIVTATERLRVETDTDEGQEGEAQEAPEGEDSSEEEPSNARTAMKQLHAAREKPVEPQQK